MQFLIVISTSLWMLYLAQLFRINLLNLSTKFIDMHKIAYLLFLAMIHLFVNAQNPLAIPDTLSGTSFSLDLQNGTTSFYSNTTTHTMGANGNLLGPTLIFQKGDLVSIDVLNSLSEPTTLHWHGLHVSAENDGGPHTVIPPGTTWSPSFIVMDQAATYWYHPHLHQKTAEHVTKGIAGFIIVRDADEAQLNLPRTYGLDDLPLVIQSRAFDANKQFVVKSALDSVMLVNGTKHPYVQLPAQVVRLRLLNGSTERVYHLGFEGNLAFHQIATDGGLLDAPVSLTRITLAPGERAEALVDLSAIQGQVTHLISFASELPNGIYGADNPSIMPMGSIAGYSNNHLNGSDFTILRIEVVAPTANPISTIPATLIPQTPYASANANTTRTLTFSPAQMGPGTMINGPFEINNVSFDMNVINFQVPMNNTEIWQLTNQTGIAHPFHIHDVQFYLLSINGAVPPAHMQGRKDVVLVPAMQTVSFITKFEDFANASVPYLYHCHMLTHEDEGMMGQFTVIGNTTGLENSKDLTVSRINIFPNPARGSVQVQIVNPGENIQSIELFDSVGRLLLSETMHTQSHLLDIRHFSANVLLIRIKTSAGYVWKQILKR